MDASLISQMKAIENEDRRLKRMYADLGMPADLLKEALGKSDAVIWTPRNGRDGGGAPQGQPCARTMVLGPMANLTSPCQVFWVKRRGKPKDDGERSVIADNILDQDFQADRPNQTWLADLTSIWTAEGWLYVAVVLDLFSRRVVGWSMKAERDTSLVMDALIMAVWRRGKADALLHHSDQGSQYTSEHFQKLMADNGITCSMSRAGNVWDNSAMESFFSSLKTERTAHKLYRTRNEARADVFDYIERFYNPRRRHSNLGYLSPMEFEARAMLA